MERTAVLSKRIAIVDAGSFILPYDFQLIQGLVAHGVAVDFYASRTRYNDQFLDALRRLPGVTVRAHAISGTVAARWKGALAYIGLLARLLWNGPRYDAVNLQFSGWWPAELPVLFALRRKLIFTVHNAVPHDSAATTHGPTRRIAAMARSLVFASESTRDDFMRRYGETFRAKSSVLPHGLLPIAPQLPPSDYMPPGEPRSLVYWSTVKPYKGVELFADLARSSAVHQQGLSLEVYGAWAPQLRPLHDELISLGVRVRDAYLDDAELLALLAKDAVFVLPYQQASQSGALYSLLNHGRIFICSDVGDLGDFMRRFGLEGLLLKDRTAEAVLACLQHLRTHRDELTQRFRRAQEMSRWDRLLADHGAAYLGR